MPAYDPRQVAQDLRLLDRAGRLFEVGRLAHDQAHRISKGGQRAVVDCFGWALEYQVPQQPLLIAHVVCYVILARGVSATSAKLLVRRREARALGRDQGDPGALCREGRRDQQTVQRLERLSRLLRQAFFGCHGYRLTTSSSRYV